MNIIDHLLQEHDEFRAALKKLETAPKDFEKVRVSVLAHAEGEEKVLYPVLVDEKETHELILEGVQEHKAAELFMREMARVKGKSDAETWAAQVKVLTEIVEHHLDEEETGVFQPARSLLVVGELEKLNRQYEEEEEKAKKRLQKKYA
jgi:hemerythrin-like domain-containing protein